MKYVEGAAQHRNTKPLKTLWKMQSARNINVHFLIVYRYTDTQLKAHTHFHHLGPEKPHFNVLRREHRV